uniref:Chromo domain-containing protein n=1 Tax=Amphiprion percula TaxID=161767 RepID=A0A3P8TAU9_AMPPE
MATVSGGANLGVPGTSQASSGVFAHRKKDSTQLDVVRQWMGKHYKKVALAAVTLQLLHPALTKLPAQCYLDLRPGGGLCHILALLTSSKLNRAGV